jgi:hypothetical protein
VVSRVCEQLFPIAGDNKNIQVSIRVRSSCACTESQWSPGSVSSSSPLQGTTRTSR